MTGEFKGEGNLRGGTAPVNGNQFLAGIVPVVDHAIRNYGGKEMRRKGEIQWLSAEQLKWKT
jgi:hypothetical protein